VSFALQTLAPSPGQATTTTAPSAPGPASPQEPPSGLGMLLPILMFLPLILMMFWSSRSQQKKQQKVLAELKKGDFVLTQSGIRGKLVEMGDRFAKIEVAPGMKIDVLKSAVLGKDTAETGAQLEKK
jgi:preprotein translocase subunit YajC